jgi:hypothetical protein
MNSAAARSSHGGVENAANFFLTAAGARWAKKVGCIFGPRRGQGRTRISIDGCGCSTTRSGEGARSGNYSMTI